MRWMYLRFSLILLLAVMTLHFHLLLSKPNLLAFFSRSSLQTLYHRYPLYVAAFAIIALGYLLLSIVPMVFKEKRAYELSFHHEKVLFIGYGLLSVFWIVTILVILFIDTLQTVHINQPRLHDLWMILTVFMVASSIHLLLVKFKD